MVGMEAHKLLPRLPVICAHRQQPGPARWCHPPPTHSPGSKQGGRLGTEQDADGGHHFQGASGGGAAAVADIGAHEETAAKEEPALPTSWVWPPREEPGVCLLQLAHRPGNQGSQQLRQRRPRLGSLRWGRRLLVLRQQRRRRCWNRRGLAAQAALAQGPHCARRKEAVELKWAKAPRLGATLQTEAAHSPAKPAERPGTTNAGAGRKLSRAAAFILPTSSSPPLSKPDRQDRPQQWCKHRLRHAGGVNRACRQGSACSGAVGRAEQVRRMKGRATCLAPRQSHWHSVAVMLASVLLAICLPTCHAPTPAGLASLNLSKNAFTQLTRAWCLPSATLRCPAGLSASLPKPLSQCTYKVPASFAGHVSEGRCTTQQGVRGAEQRSSD